MKLLIVAYDQSIEESMMEAINELELSGWTKVFNAHGFGGAGYKLGDAIWPGQVNLLYLQLADERVEDVAKAIREMQGAYRLKPGVTIWSLPVDVL